MNRAMREIAGKWRWLGSDNAIQAHFVCLLVVVICLLGLVDGDNGWPREERLVVLLFVLVSYPILLVLIWLQWRLDPIN